MAYVRPNAFERKVFNKLAMRFNISGAHSLRVPRRGGGDCRVPVIPVDHDGHRYVVSTRGDSHWVRALRASQGSGRLRGKEGEQAFTAVELPTEQRAPVIAAYRTKAGKFVDRYFSELPDDADHPVFRLDPSR